MDGFTDWLGSAFLGCLIAGLVATLLAPKYVALASAISAAVPMLVILVPTKSLTLAVPVFIFGLMGFGIGMGAILLVKYAWVEFRRSADK